MFCTRCGTENHPGNALCTNCGSALTGTVSAQPTSLLLVPPPEVDAEVVDVDSLRQAAAELPQAAALLLVEEGPGTGARFTLDNATVAAGRSIDSDIVLNDPSVSRSHAQIRRDGSDYVIYDVGSLNGTFVNRRRVDQAPLADGDEVQIGKYRLLYVSSSSNS